ncbi:Elongator complex protein 4 [Strongyloides ratti]|uniref:Elongator complex protein 4 n=1 Tax=Strongyloides ratti TaxID=34506 RepID=A0A090LQK3_STRRB|nr:Elongator complex protein 4 [Strongyloides ratti]CEF70461.1 Elongator complex protein 4 [Strongyloides ratti]
MNVLRNPLADINHGTQIPGLKQKFRTYDISSGLESFDALFGGSIPCSSIIALEENNSSEYSEILVKYSIGEGISHGHKIFIASSDGQNLQNLKNGLLDKIPGISKCKEDNKDVNEKMPTHDDRMQIAWRYHSLNQIDSSLAKSHRLDIHDTMAEEEVVGGDIIGYVSENPTYQELWNFLKHNILKNEVIKNRKGACRIIIDKLGSYADTTDNLIKFLRLLQMYTRGLHCLIYLTYNGDVLEKNMLDAILDISNAVFSLIAYEHTRGLFDKFNGRLLIKKLPCITSVSPFKPRSVDLVFQKHKRYLEIRVFHLPPSLGVEDDIGAKKDNSVSIKRKHPTGNRCTMIEDEF